MQATIYHNPRCSTSRNTLALLRERGIEPRIIHYLEDPLTREAIAQLIAASGLSARQAIREKEELFQTLGLTQASDEALLDAMTAHPRLLNRPFVVTERGARLARPVEKVLEIL
ncbi:MAG: arsenate reductase (glutaredoxin) [Comamonadaceae bacterium]|nr:arsenate reductase (glutaredoxin) [Comamonadaceae bacterium]